MRLEFNLASFAIPTSIRIVEFNPYQHQRRSPFPLTLSFFFFLFFKYSFRPHSPNPTNNRNRRPLHPRHNRSPSTKLHPSCRHRAGRKRHAFLQRRLQHARRSIRCRSTDLIPQRSDCQIFPLPRSQNRPFDQCAFWRSRGLESSVGVFEREWTLIDR